MKKILFFFVFSLLFGSLYAQLKSPAEFLGYKIGTKITPHWKMLDYYKYIAAEVPTMVKFESYGESIEGRPLLVFYISSAQNIANLENIRQNNLYLAGEIKENVVLNKMPAIVWLSNNAHGNETSSGEAAMMTLFELVNPKNNKTKQELANTLIILDPCLNPDGTERYNNWQNGILGSKYEANPIAREHNEPWPSGRLNHYYFDLNRDWAWQTQQESILRAKIYNRWLPHVHLDFHEMGINAPYYFPPAAEPLHEVITPWQREFQTTIGKHNAAYFDKQGWLYFTKERFDLFYPSYGDTYPVYLGAIGMTYEKAGNGSAGLGVLTAANDTLTLVDRAIQHHASGLNVLEIVSQNADRVVQEFKNFYTRSKAGELSTYQSYVIKNTQTDQGKIRALLELLDKNKIRYYAASGVFKGIDYGTKINETYQAKEGDLLIPGNQPKGALVRVLFEPEAKLVDSVTYDITAWALPYVYGVKALASSTKIQDFKPYVLNQINNLVDENFAYAIKWDDFSAAQLLSSLLQNKVAVKTSEYSFKLLNEDFPRGSIIITAAENRTINLKQILKEQADKYAVRIYPVKSGILEGGKDLGSSDVKKMKAPRVMMLAGEEQRALNVGEVWHFFDHQLGYPIILVNPKDVNRIKWSEVDVFIMPKGSYSFLKDKNQSETFSNWLKAGGKVIALENAISQLATQSWSTIKAIKQDSTIKAKENPFKQYAHRERQALTDYTAGAIFKVDYDATHPLMYGVNQYYTLKQDASLFQYFKDGEGWNVGYLKDSSLVSGFVGVNLKKKLKNGLVFGTQSVGAGTVIYLADNVLFRNFWHAGKMVLSNALFQVN